MNSNDLFASKVAFKQEMEKFLRSLKTNGRIFITNEKTPFNKVISENGKPYYVNAIYDKPVGQGYTKLFVSIFEPNEDAPGEYEAVNDIDFWWNLSLNEQYEICRIAQMYTEWK